MAGAGRLKKPAARRLTAVLVALTLAVLLGHLLALDWLARHAPMGQGLQEMPEPLFTRVLAPSEQEPVVVALPPPPAPTPAVREATVVAAAPAPAASEPAPAAASEPAPAASDAQPPASASAPAVAHDRSPPASEPTALAARPTAEPASAAGLPADDPFAQLWPVDTRVSYKLSGQFRGGPLYGSARVQWLRQGDQYQARVELSISPFFGATYTSQGQVTAAGLIPQAFEDTRGSRRRLTRFTEKEVVLPDGKSFERPPGVQDMASQFIELGHRFRTGQATTALGSSLTLPLVRPGAVDTWTYDIFAHELLSTPRLGELDTVRVTPRPFTNARGTLSSEIWFAPRLQYLPVRFKVTFGEEAMVDLVVETIEQR